MYFFDLDDYCNSKFIGSDAIEAVYSPTWEDVFLTLGVTRDAYKTSFTSWYNCSYAKLPDSPCKTKIGDLYKLIVDSTAPNTEGPVMATLRIAIGLFEDALAASAFTETVYNYYTQSVDSFVSACDELTILINDFSNNSSLNCNVEAYNFDVEVIRIKLTSETAPEKLEASATTVNFQSLSQTDETPRSNSTQPLYYTYEVNKSVDSYGDITQQQLDTLNSQVSTMNASNSNNYFASTTGTTSYGVYITNYNCSPEFIGKATVKLIQNDSRNQPRNY